MYSNLVYIDIDINFTSSVYLQFLRKQSLSFLFIYGEPTHVHTQISHFTQINKNNNIKLIKIKLFSTTKRK